ncbi:MAG: hypothetical protein Q8P95_03480 [bacterium]|nr:hypothetical protein [bacterium]
MSGININIGDFTWQIIIAAMGGAFAVFSMIYNEEYIYYGLVTFGFGVSAHVVYKFFEWIFRKNSTVNKYYWLAHLANAMLVAAWIIILLWIY